MTLTGTLPGDGFGFQLRHPLSWEIQAGSYPVVPEPIQMLVAADDQLEAASAQLREPFESLTAQMSRVADEIAAGKPLPEDLGAMAAAAASTEENRRMGLLALSQIQTKITSQFQRAVQTHLAEMLEGLRPELVEIVDAVRDAVAELDGLDVSDAEAVAEASDEQRKAMSKLKALRPRYEALRRLQRELLEGAWERPPWTRSPFDATPYSWAAHVWETRIHEFRGGAPADVSKLLWFRPLLNTANVWIPTVDELGNAMLPPSSPTT